MQNLHIPNLFRTFAAKIENLMRTATITKHRSIPNGGVAPAYPTISLAELERTSISVDESEARISELIHDFYHPQV